MTYDQELSAKSSQSTTTATPQKSSSSSTAPASTTPRRVRSYRPTQETPESTQQQPIHTKKKEPAKTSVLALGRGSARKTTSRTPSPTSSSSDSESEETSKLSAQKSTAKSEASTPNRRPATRRAIATPKSAPPATRATSKATKTDTVTETTVNDSAQKKSKRTYLRSIPSSNEHSIVDELRLTELRDLCRRLHLKVAGTKAELQSRLITHLKQNPEDEPQISLVLYSPSAKRITFDSHARGAKRSIRETEDQKSIPVSRELFNEENAPKSQEEEEPEFLLSESEEQEPPLKRYRVDTASQEEQQQDNDTMDVDFETRDTQVSEMEVTQLFITQVDSINVPVNSYDDSLMDNVVYENDFGVSHYSAEMQDDDHNSAFIRDAISQDISPVVSQSRTVEHFAAPISSVSSAQSSNVNNTRQSMVDDLGEQYSAKRGDESCVETAESQTSSRRESKSWCTVM